MNHRMNGNRTRLITITVIIVAVLVTAIVITLWASSVFRVQPSPFQHEFPPPHYVPPFWDIQLFYTIEAVFSTINIALAIVLFLVYVSIYRKTRSEFTIGLTIFSLVFLLNAVVSNPFFRGFFGYRPFGLGPFTMLPDLFTFGALIVLLYLSVEY